MRSSIVLLLILIAPAAAPAGTDLESALARLASDSSAVRRAARDELAAGGEEALPVVREGIASPIEPVAAECLRLARAEADLAARTRVVGLLEAGNRGPSVEREACLSLAVLGDYRDLDLLGGLLGEYPEAALAIAGIGDSDGLVPLRKAWEAGARWPEVAYARAVLGEESELETLVREVDPGTDRGRRALALLRRFAGADAGDTVAAWEDWLRVRRLAAGLGSLDWDASEEALRAVLERAKDPAARPATLEDLLRIARDTSRPPAARTKAVLALGRIGDPATAPALRNLLFTDADGMIRVYAAEAYGYCGGARAALELTRYLVDDEEPFRALSSKDLSVPYYTIDSEVCKSLVRLGVKGGLDYMIDQLGQDHRIRVYHQALKTLRPVTGVNLGFSPDAPRERRHASARRWRRWFDEHRSEIRLDGTADFQDPEFRGAVARLVSRLDIYKFIYMLRSREMLKLLGERALPELIDGLSRPEVHVRVHCAEILGWIRATRARAALARNLHASRREVSTAAAAALADMGPGEEAREAILAALRDDSYENTDVRIEAARALAKVDPSVAVPALERALADPANDSDSFRLRAWYALASHGDPEAVDRLEGLLDREEAAFRMAVAARLLELTGRDPGTERDTIDPWRRWWTVNRNRYTSLRTQGTGK